MPKRKEDYKEIVEERLHSIHKAALPLFSLKGYDSVTVDDITKSAKCSHGLFYHYYKNKEELFIDMMREINEKWDASIAKINYDQKPIFVLRDITNFYLSVLNSNDYSAQILYLFLTFHLQKKLPSLKKAIKPASDKKRPFEELLDVFVIGQKEGTFIQIDPIDMSKMYYSALLGLAYNRIYLGSKKYKQPNPELLINMMLAKGGDKEC